MYNLKNLSPFSFLFIRVYKEICTDVIVVYIEKRYQEISVDSNLKRILSKPPLIIILIYSIIIYIYNDYNPIGDSRFISILFFPLLPIIVQEFIWDVNIKKERQNAYIHYSIIKKHRITFIASGIVFSTFLIPIALFYRVITGIKPNTPNDSIFGTFFPLISIIYLNIATMLFAFFTVASFYRIKAENHINGKRYHFISSPSQISLLMSYSYAFSNLGIWIIWAAENFNPSAQLTYLTYLDTILLESTPAIFSISFTFYFTSIFIAKFIPKLIMQGGYKKPKRNELLSWVGSLLIILTILSVLSGLSSSFYLQTQGLHNTIHNFFILWAPILLTIYTMTLSKGVSVCSNCNIGLIKGKCPACLEGDKIDLSLKMTQFKKFSHPMCPSCGSNWVSLSRMCSICNFTILLSCERCSQTINPLWNKCNYCGEARSNIPTIALSSTGSIGYARTSSLLKFLFAIIFIILIYQVIILTNIILFILDDTISDGYIYYIYDDIGRILYLFLLDFGIIILMILSTRDEYSPFVMIASKIAIAPASIILIASVIKLIHVTFLAFFQDQRKTIIQKLLSFVLGTIICIFTLVNYFRGLLQYQPVMPFNPINVLSNEERRSIQ